MTRQAMMENTDPILWPTVAKWRWCTDFTWLVCHGVEFGVNGLLCYLMQRFFKILLWLQDCRTPKLRLRLRRFRTSTQWCRPTHSGRSTGQAVTSFICCRGFEQLWMTFLNLANFIFLLIIFDTYRNSKYAPQWKNKKWENKEWFGMAFRWKALLRSKHNLQQFCWFRGWGHGLVKPWLLLK